MDLNEYQQLTARTDNADIPPHQRRLNYALGLGEAGELQNVIKKHAFHGHSMEETRPLVLDEMGDIMWYLARLAGLYGLSLEQVAQHNIDKLRKRYPEGFSEEASQNRAENS